jgi:hypothetical protein
MNTRVFFCTHFDSTRNLLNFYQSLLASPCLCVRPSDPCNTSRTAERIFIKFDIELY